MTEAILDRAEALVANSMPMKRIGKPGELAPTVLFLASEGASYITGQVVAIDGGGRHNNYFFELSILTPLSSSYSMM